MNKTVEQAVEELKGDPKTLGSFWPDAFYLAYNQEKNRYDWWIKDYSNAFGWVVVCSLNEFNKAAVQWKAKQGKEWVDGLPPIDSVVTIENPEDYEVLYGNYLVGTGKRAIVRSNFNSGETPVSAVEHGGNCYCFRTSMLRPQKSDRDKAIEEMAKDIANHRSLDGTVTWDEFAKGLYQDGYRKQMSRKEAGVILMRILEQEHGYTYQTILDALGFDQ